MTQIFTTMKIQEDRKISPTVKRQTVFKIRKFPAAITRMQ